MKANTNNQQLNGKSLHKPGIPTTPKVHDEKVLEAHRQADQDIENDPDFQMHTRTHDLDEGEIARLGDE